MTEFFGYPKVEIVTETEGVAVKVNRKWEVKRSGAFRLPESGKSSGTGGRLETAGQLQVG